MKKYVVKIKKATGYQHYTITALHAVDALTAVGKLQEVDLDDSVSTVCTLDKYSS